MKVIKMFITGIVILTVLVGIFAPRGRMEPETGEISEAKERAPAASPEEEPEPGLKKTPSGNVYTDEIPMRNGYQCAMQDACRRYNVPYALALGIAETESGWDFQAWSGWAYGLMQINPINYGWLRELGMDPETNVGNIEAGVYMIGDLISRYGDPRLALMAYNCGETGAQELWDAGQTTSEYAEKVMAAAEKWGEVVGGGTG